MYIPEDFEVTEEDALFSVIDGSGLATLVTAAGIFDRTVAKYESWLPRPWRLDEAPDLYVEQLLPHVVAFELEVSSLRGQFKLSQNQSPENRRGVIEALEQRPDGGSRGVAELMSEQDLHTRP